MERYKSELCVSIGDLADALEAAPPGLLLRQLTSTFWSRLNLPGETTSVRDGDRMIERTIHPSVSAVAMGTPMYTDAELPPGVNPPVVVRGSETAVALANILRRTYPERAPLRVPVIVRDLVEAPPPSNLRPNKLPEGASQNGTRTADGCEAVVTTVPSQLFLEIRGLVDTDSLAALNSYARTAHQEPEAQPEPARKRASGGGR